MGTDRTFDPEGGLAGAHRRQRVLDLHQLTRRAARHRNLVRSAAQAKSPRRERERMRGSRYLKVVSEKEYWLSPMVDYLAGRLLPLLSSGKRIGFCFESPWEGKKTQRGRRGRKKGRRGICHEGPDRLHDTNTVGCYRRFVAVHRSIAGLSSGLS